MLSDTNPFTDKSMNMNQVYSTNPFLNGSFSAPTDHSVVPSGTVFDMPNPYTTAESVAVEVDCEEPILSSPTFIFTTMASKHGKHDTLMYKIPSSTSAYTFYHKRTNKNSEVYSCNGHVTTKSFT